MSEQAKRLALNEALFRRINRRIAGTAEAWDVADEPIGFYCECADPECIDRILMLPAAFERIHASPARFVVRPGHDVAVIERVVQRHSDYLVVQKLGDAGELAQALDDAGV
jgi:hypothetical protein